MNRSELQSITGRRVSAAEASGGISNLCIYDCLECVLDKLGAKGKVLDFGAGKGLLIQRLRKRRRFSLYAGVDIMRRPPALDASIAWYVQDLNEPTNFNDGSWDVIVSAEVIEHLENPRATVREWARLLKPGGLLVFSTPNNESLRSIMSLIFRGHYADFSDSSYPAHITPLLRKDIERIMQEARCGSTKVYFTNNGRIPKLTRFSWQSLSLGLCRGVRFSDNIVISACKI